ncbi:hypothetical protein F5879DRAFT_919436 [Lentinula edodes]|nr:hypothetical protein F5879DRAFT_919436 [Lentinula edodes]
MKHNNRTRNALRPEQLKPLVVILNQTIYPSEHNIAKLSNETGLTQPEIKNWFYNQRRKLRRKASKLDQTLTQLCQEQWRAISQGHFDPFYRGCTCSSYYAPPMQLLEENKITLPPIAIMFPDIFNDMYDYTLPPHVHPIDLSNPL